MRVLIVKTSSLGDIIHTFPAVTDACRAQRDLRFDWVVEEAFAEVPPWHPAVERVIPVALRRWRKSLAQCWRRGEFRDFKESLQSTRYDLIIDAQGLLKSGLISRMAHGLTAGLSNRSAREPLAALFYNRIHPVPRNRHAVARTRELFAKALAYPLPKHPCDYGLDPQRFRQADTQDNNKDCKEAGQYLVFVHGATWESKQWPWQYWASLAQIAAENGFKVKLPWGSEAERRRAQAIQKEADNVEILERSGMTKLAQVLAGASAVVAVDTGLAHLTAALDVPSVSIYGASSHELTGAYGPRQLHVVNAMLPCSPCLKKRCRLRGEDRRDQYRGHSFAVNPPCYAENPPAMVWQQLARILR